MVVFRTLLTHVWTSGLHLKLCVCVCCDSAPWEASTARIQQALLPHTAVGLAQGLTSLLEISRCMGIDTVH